MELALITAFLLIKLLSLVTPRSDVLLYVEKFLTILSSWHRFHPSLDVRHSLFLKSQILQTMFSVLLATGSVLIDSRDCSVRKSLLDWVPNGKEYYLEDSIYKQMTL